MIPYLFLLSAVSCDIIATGLIKASCGCTKAEFAFPGYCLYTLSFFLFSIALKNINLAVADIIWKGLGIILITLMSWIVFNEPLSWRQVLFMGVTLIGVIGISLG